MLKLASEFVIDAAVARCPDGLYRLWYKDEGNGSCTQAAVSTDLYSWTHEGIAIPGSRQGGRGHEGPNVFELGGHYWMIVDEWRGQAVFRSDDTLTWERQGLILDLPGDDPDDRQVARHADVLVQDGWAALVYFTHPNTGTDHTHEMDTPSARRSTIHWARLTVEDGVLRCDRNVGTLQLQALRD